MLTLVNLYDKSCPPENGVSQPRKKTVMRSLVMVPSAPVAAYFRQWATFVAMSHGRLPGRSVPASGIHSVLAEFPRPQRI
jgi:hypothetical protein